MKKILTLLLALMLVTGCSQVEDIEFEDISDYNTALIRCLLYSEPSELLTENAIKTLCAEGVSCSTEYIQLLCNDIHPNSRYISICQVRVPSSDGERIWEGTYKFEFSLNDAGKVQEVKVSDCGTL